MAGEWLKMECDTPDKAEVMAITGALGWDDTDLTVGKLFKLWRWFDKQTVDGNAVGVTLALLDKVVGVTGFCEKMIAVNWLEVYDGGVRLPNFDCHNGVTAKARAQTAKRVAKFKDNARGNGDANATGNAKTVTGALPREEKRREEDKSPPTPRKRGKGGDEIPYDDILASFRELLPSLEAPMKATDKRRRAIRKTWEYLPVDHRKLGAYKAIFAECAVDPFYNGTGPYRDENANWRPTFDFIVREDQFVKVYEKAMHRRRAQAQAQAQANGGSAQAGQVLQ